MRHMGKLKHVGKLSEVVVLSQYARDFWSKRSRSMSWPEITEFLFSETHKISQSAFPKPRRKIEPLHCLQRQEHGMICQSLRDFFTYAITFILHLQFGSVLCQLA